MPLNDKIRHELKTLHSQLSNEGKVLNEKKLEECYTLFRTRFGPEVISKWEGETLLNNMHLHGNYDSLVYWLEFKDDEELPFYFGSISGGSALKFGIFKRKETGEWIVGSSQKQKVVSIDEAVEVARRHRDDLLSAAKLIEAIPENANDDVYAELQKKLDAKAPSIRDTAWGHKYLCMLFPTKIDDYHNPAYQRFHLNKVLIRPPAGEGRFICAGRFVQLAKELQIPVNNLTQLMNIRNGSPHTYWRVGASNGEQSRNRWELMRDGNCIAIGWSALGDLKNIPWNKEAKDNLKIELAKRYPKDPTQVGRETQQIFNFLHGVQEGDVVAVADGATILGIAKVTGGYWFEAGQDFPNRKPVKWLSLEEWQQPEQEGWRQAVSELSKPENLFAIEQHILNSKSLELITPPIRPNVAQDGLVERIHGILQRKGQVILYGPPGTGKTYWARIAARELAAAKRFGKRYSALTDSEREVVGSSSAALTRTCCFHPAYGYEDFIEGYRPASGDASLSFQLRDGVFKKLCQDARDHPDSHFFLIIDEINRGDIPRIFGELLMLVEKDKRGESTLILPLSGQSFSVPKNIHIIGTMNTADRSIALLDTALRRRFGFIELMPDYALLAKAKVEGISVAHWLEGLNRRICDHAGRDARNLQVGHAYFMDSGDAVKSIVTFTRTVRDDIVPLLQEYCYEDYEALEKILGKRVIDLKKRRICMEIFEESQREQFIAAMIEIYKDVFTDSAINMQGSSDDPDETKDDEDNES